MAASAKNKNGDLVTVTKYEDVCCKWRNILHFFLVLQKFASFSDNCKLFVMSYNNTNDKHTSRYPSLVSKALISGRYCLAFL